MPSGIPVRTVKSFLTKIPSVFTGTVRHKSFRRISHLALSSKSYLWYVFIYFQDLIQWLLNNLDLSDQNEALQLANRMAECGYFFPIDDGHVLQVKNDGTYYRFQVSALLSKYSMFEIQVQKEKNLDQHQTRISNVGFVTTSFIENVP